MKEQPTLLWSHHQIAQYLVDNFDYWLQDVRARLEPYHHLLPIEIGTHVSKPVVTISIGSNRYDHESTREAAVDVVL